MTTLSQIRSQFRNFGVFRKYFTPRYLTREAFLFPYDYVCNQGRSSCLSNINLILTSKCNLSCNICSYRQEINRQYDELSYDEITSLIDSASHDKPFVHLGGGEPLLRPDILQIIKLVKERGMFCTICTNGVLLNKKTADSMVDSGIDSIIFSLHGVGAVQDKIAGRKGCFERQIKNLTYLCRKKKNTQVVINSIVTEENIENAEELIKILNTCGVDILRFQHRAFLTKAEYEKNKVIKKIFNDNTYVCLQHVSTTDHYDYSERIAHLRKIKNLFFSPQLTRREIKGWYNTSVFDTTRKCLFLWRGTFIMPNGDVVPCPYHKLVLGNVREQSLAEIWNNEKYVKLRRMIKKDLLPGCSRCCKL